MIIEFLITLPKPKPMVESGGIATNIGIHFFDLLIWLFGEIANIEPIFGPYRVIALSGSFDVILHDGLKKTIHNYSL